MDITTIILTYNEEIHIERCISNAQKISKKVIVVDSFSTDATCNIAKGLGAEVFQHKFVNQADQLQWALDNIEVDTEWVLRLDADGYLLQPLIEEIEEKLPNLPENVTGCIFPRDVVFLGKKLRYGKIKSPAFLRLWRNGNAFIEQRWMDEHAILKEGEAYTFKNHFVDHSLHNLTWWTQKHNNYSNREIVVELSKNFRIYEETDSMKARNSQKSLYYRLPIFLRASMYFFIRYFILLGFLDGKAGLAWNFLQGFWYRFLIDSKMHELQLALGENPSDANVKRYIKEEYGIDI